MGRRIHHHRRGLLGRIAAHHRDRPRFRGRHLQGAAGYGRSDAAQVHPVRGCLRDRRDGGVHHMGAGRRPQAVQQPDHIHPRQAEEGPGDREGVLHPQAVQHHSREPRRRDEAHGGVEEPPLRRVHQLRCHGGRPPGIAGPRLPLPDRELPVQEGPEREHLRPGVRDEDSRRPEGGPPSAERGSDVLQREPGEVHTGRVRGGGSQARRRGRA